MMDAPAAPASADAPRTPPPFEPAAPREAAARARREAPGDSVEAARPAPEPRPEPVVAPPPPRMRDREPEAPLPAPAHLRAERPTAPARPASPPAAPQVQITIGRVEIRAATPAQPAPRRTPAMSLEDYLARRAQS